MPVNRDSGTTFNFRLFFIVLLTLLVSLAFFSLIADFMEAVIMAAIISALVHPVYRKLLGGVGNKPALASFLTIILFVVGVFIPFIIFAQLLLDQAASIGAYSEAWLQKYSQEVDVDVESLKSKLLQIGPSQSDIMGRVSEIVSGLGKYISQLISSTAKGTINFIFMLFILLYAMYYFLKDGPQMLDRIFSVLPFTDEEQQGIENTFVAVSSAIIKGSLVVALAQGTLGGIGFAVAGIDGFIFWGALMAFLSLLPLVGAPLVWVPVVIYLVLEGQMVTAIALGAWCAIVVSSIDNILRPLLVGKDTQMPDLLVLLTSLGGLGMFGASGLLLGPLIGALFLTAWNFWGNMKNQPGLKSD
ncbi:MAG: AI-2E family transporter [Thiolinea sp.]